MTPGLRHFSTTAALFAASSLHSGCVDDRHAARMPPIDEPPPIEATFTPVMLDPITMQQNFLYLFLRSGGVVAIRRGESPSVDTLSLEAFAHIARREAFQNPHLRILLCIDGRTRFEHVFRLFSDLRAAAVRQVILNPPPRSWTYAHAIHWNSGEDQFVILRTDHDSFVPCSDWHPDPDERRV